MTPARALATLKEGNARFARGATLDRDHLEQVRSTASGQFPFAVILGCIDSRVPPEIVFDQGIGDIFSVRIAGNTAGNDILGSIEFATRVVGAKLVVVLGHSDCGAVRGACDGRPFGYVTRVIESLAPDIEAVTDIQDDRTSRNEAFVHRVAETNVRMTVRHLTDRSAVLEELIRRKVDDIVLNVSQSNDAAIRIYERLGFRRHCPFLEGPASAKD